MKKEQINILLIEDDPEDADFLQDILSERNAHSFEVKWVESLQVGLKYLAQGRIDLILLDLSLPDSQGLETFTQTYSQVPDIPIVVLSGLDDETVAVKAVQHGAQDYLVKGEVDSNLLVRSLRYAIERKRAEHALQQAHDELERRVAERTAELRKANLELEAFAHTVAHDLKSPLNVIVGIADMLRGNLLTMAPEDLWEYLHLIVRSGHKMTNIVNELILLASMHKSKVKMQPLNMAGIVLEAQQRLACLIEEYQAKLIVPDTWPVAIGYAPWVEEVWVNYLSNALKYGGQPPRVELGAMAQAHDMVRFWVRDNGSGLSPEMQAQLFTPFTRLDRIRAEGHGLGLSIVQRIVEKLGGQVGVESDIGRGSIFFFTLPGMNNNP